MPATIEVMIVDRHAIVRECIRRIAADTADIAIADEASSLRAASAAVRSRRFDLLVADIATEGGIALDGIRQLRSIAPAVPILVFSG
ncbi:MAG TPA: response regulator, partial [Rhodocyclaceae bacterium]